ncbi:TadE/TadG family type IV pilus assembly protein [Phenylobacterium sp.]|uniref:TadE/TadG family type IV pilus assembly protein n=1 Tax=Phenylobacterium sp. TaxID=1871053 RepID=UPI0039835B23
MIGRLRRDAGGATAVEFALVLPAFLALIVGSLSAGNLGFTVSSLQFAVQAAARCSAVNTTLCNSASATVAYAQSRYMGPTISPTFTSTTAGCGHTVSASATFGFHVATRTIGVPLTASACYPSASTS